MQCGAIWHLQGSRCPVAFRRFCPRSCNGPMQGRFGRPSVMSLLPFCFRARNTAKHFFVVPGGLRPRLLVHADEACPSRERLSDCLKCASVLYHGRGIHSLLFSVVHMCRRACYPSCSIGFQFPAKDVWTEAMLNVRQDGESIRMSCGFGLCNVFHSLRSGGAHNPAQSFWTATRVQRVGSQGRVAQLFWLSRRPCAQDGCHHDISKGTRP